MEKFNTSTCVCVCVCVYQCAVLRVWVFEVDDVRWNLFHLGHVSFTCSLEQWVTFELIWEIYKQRRKKRGKKKKSLKFTEFHRVGTKAKLWNNKRMRVVQNCATDLQFKRNRVKAKLWVQAPPLNKPTISPVFQPSLTNALTCVCYSQVSLSRSSGVCASSMALLPWQLRTVGSAPWLSSSEHTSARFLLAASCRGVNCHRSMAFTHAPCWHTHTHTSQSNHSDRYWDQQWTYTAANLSERRRRDQENTLITVYWVCGGQCRVSPSAAAQSPHSDRTSRRYGEEPDLWEKKRDIICMCVCVC